MDGLFIYVLPAGAVLIGAVAFFFARMESNAFDRRYGRKSKAIGDLFDKKHA